MLRDQRLEFPDELSALSESEIGLNPLLERVEPELFETSDLGLRERLECKVGERWASPERERFAQLRRAHRGLCPSRLLDMPLEESDVKSLAVDLQHIARRARDQTLRTEQLAELRNEVLQR